MASANDNGIGPYRLVLFSFSLRLLVSYLLFGSQIYLSSGHQFCGMNQFDERRGNLFARSQLRNNIYTRLRAVGRYADGDDCVPVCTRIRQKYIE